MIENADTVSTACRVQHHENERVYYLCLDEKCSLPRVLCRKCVHQTHRKHKIGAIDKLVDPLNRLNQNSFHITSEADHSFLLECMNSICQQWEKMAELFDKNMKELENGIIAQLEMLIRTFTQEDIDETFKVLSKPDADSVTIDKIVAKVNFLGKEGFQDVEKIKKFASVVSKRVQKTIDKAHKKIQYIMSRMQSQIKGFDFSKMETHDFTKETQDNQAEEKNEDPTNRGKGRKDTLYQQLNQETTASWTMGGHGRQIQRNK